MSYFVSCIVLNPHIYIIIVNHQTVNMVISLRPKSRMINPICVCNQKLVKVKTCQTEINRFPYIVVAYKMNLKCHKVGILTNGKQNMTNSSVCFQIFPMIFVLAETIMYKFMGGFISKSTLTCFEV